MVYRCYTMCDPIAGPFVILDLKPVMVFKIELDGKVRAFKEDKVPNVVANLQPGSVLQISSGDIPVSPSSNWHPSPEIFPRCHDGEVQPNVTTRRVILLNLSSFGGSVKHKVPVLVGSDLHYKM